MPNSNSAESVEPRVLAKRKAAQTPVTATQSAEQAESGLRRLHAAAKRDPHLQFNNLLHHITPKRLYEAYLSLNRKAAKGIDEQSWQMYGEQNLGAKLKELQQRIHTGRYRPKASKRIWIPKANGKQRPIGTRGAISGKANTLLSQLGIDPNKWIDHVVGFGRRYARCAGSAESMGRYAEHFEYRWGKGMGFSRQVYKKCA